MFLALTISMLFLSAFFSGTEIAFVSASKLKIKLKSLSGSKKGSILQKFINNTPRVITTILVGNNIALVIFGISIAKLLAPVILEIPGIEATDINRILVIQTIISTIVILVFGEYLPKALFRLNPDRTISFIAPILNFFYILLGAFAKGINILSGFVLKRILKLRYEEEELEFSRQDLDLFVQEQARLKEGDATGEIDAEMFTNALAFNEIRAKDCMIPRTEIVSLSIASSITDLMKVFVETEKSKVIIFNENLDQVLGYVHSSSLFKKPGKIQEVVQGVLVIPETMPGNVLLTEFAANRKSIAIVVDEFGGTEGMLTMEDLVEEIFGEIDDEHDEPEEDELLAKVLSENSWLFSARHEVDDINKAYKLMLPEGDYNTLAGLVIHIAEDIPKTDEIITVENYLITVMDASEIKINTVKIERIGQ